MKSFQVFVEHEVFFAHLFHCILNNSTTEKVKILIRFYNLKDLLDISIMSKEVVEAVQFGLGEYSGEVVDSRPHGRGKLVGRHSLT